MIHIGTAGWAIPRRFAGLFPESGSGLERYTARFNGTEINSTFYRSHKPQTYARWAAAVPANFRFAVKLPRTITHDRRLVETGTLLDRFLEEVQILRPKLGPLLIQLPPSLAFDVKSAGAFLDDLRRRHKGPVACEPRHPSWFGADADRLLSSYEVARVAADPARVPEAAVPGGWAGLVYIRLHGAPRVYYSEYDDETLAEWAARLEPSVSAETWCVFDNTASGAATGNALTFGARLNPGGAGEAGR